MVLYSLTCADRVSLVDANFKTTKLSRTSMLRFDSTAAFSGDKLSPSCLLVQIEYFVFPKNLPHLKINFHQDFFFIKSVSGKAE